MVYAAIRGHDKEQCLSAHRRNIHRRSLRARISACYALGKHLVIDKPHATKATGEICPLLCIWGQSKLVCFIANHAKGIQKVDFVDEGRTTFTDINGQHIEIKKEKSYALNSLRFDETNYLAGKLTPIGHLEEGEEKRIIVSIYMEGWDEYMTDEIASASFDVNISFTGIID